MQQLHQPDLTVKDRLRLALAFAVLECKPEKETISAFVLKLKQIHLIQTNHQADQGGPTSRPGPHRVPGQFYENEKLLSDGLSSANSQMAMLEQEVRVLKRKLMTAEKELMQNTTPLRDRSTDEVPTPNLSAKRTKRATPVSSVSAILNTGASQSLLAGKSSGTGPKKVNSRISGTGAVPPASRRASDPRRLEQTSAGEEKYVLAVGVNRGTCPDDRVENASSELDVNTVTGRVRCNVDLGTRSAVENLPRDVKTLQTLLLPLSSTSTSLHIEERQAALLELSSSVLSQISQVLQLAFASHSGNTYTPQNDFARSPLGKAQAVDGNKNPKDCADPARTIELVEMLVSGLVPRIMERLEDDDAAGQIVLAIAKGIIKPSVDAIVRLHASHRYYASHRSPEVVVDRDVQMLGRLKNLLGNLSAVNVVCSLASGGANAEQSSQRVCPFAEVMALYSTKALRAIVRDLIRQRQEVDIETTTARPLGGGSFDDVIVMLLQLARTSLDQLPYMESSTNIEELQAMEGQERAARHVRTRTCDHVTKLAADLQLEVVVPATAVLASGDVPNISAARDRDVTGDQALEDADEGRGPLWVRMGMKRETMVAICSLAEQWMMWEYYGGAGGRMAQSVYDLLDDRA